MLGLYTFDMNTLYFVMCRHMPVAISNYSQLLLLKAQNCANVCVHFHHL